MTSITMELVEPVQVEVLYAILPFQCFGVFTHKQMFTVVAILYVYVQPVIYAMYLRILGFGNLATLYEEDTL